MITIYLPNKANKMAYPNLIRDKDNDYNLPPQRSQQNGLSPPHPWYCNDNFAMMQIYLEHEAKGMAYHNLIHDKDIYTMKPIYCTSRMRLR